MHVFVFIFIFPIFIKSRLL